MKKISLNGEQITLLSKVSCAGYCFYGLFENFLEDNKNLSEEESAELVIPNDELDDIFDMIIKYLNDDSLSDRDFPSDKEKEDLQNLMEYLLILNENEETENPIMVD